VDPLGQVRAQVLVGVTNRGGMPGYLPPAATTYRVLGPRGDLVARGRFAHAFPPYIEGASTGWLIDTLSATFTDPEEIGTVEVALNGQPAQPGDSGRATALTAADTRWELADDGTVEAMGSVVNVGDRLVGRIAVGVILLGHQGEPLAGVYDVEDVRDLAPGESATFSTSYPGSPPLQMADVATARAFAVALDP
jgi:hypothetical protein